MSVMRQVASNVLGLIGAVIGGALGYYIFDWLTFYHFYGMMIPGALLGLGCGLLAQHPSRLRGLICALAALCLGVYAEWRLSPFIADRSFKYFLTNITSVNPVSLAMIAAGAFFAYWLGKDAGYRMVPGRQGSAGAVKRENSRP
jgi:hypothetical protein